MLDNQKFLATDPTPMTAPAEQSTANGTAEVEPNRHAEAGRLGAQRVHQLIRQGRIYEEEHGLTRGRQRLRQLIEEGKLYEEEHGLRVRRKRARRQSSEQQLQSFLHALVRVVKPRFRAPLVRLVQELERTGQ